MSEFKLLDKVSIIDPESRNYQKQGKIVSLYADGYFADNYGIAIGRTKEELKRKSQEVNGSFGARKKVHNYKIIRVKKEQIVLTPYPPTRGDLWRLIQKEDTSKKEIVNILKKLRDAGTLNIHLPAN